LQDTLALPLSADARPRPDQTVDLTSNRETVRRGEAYKIKGSIDDVGYGLPLMVLKHCYRYGAIDTGIETIWDSQACGLDAVTASEQQIPTLQKRSCGDKSLLGRQV
jgi:hypothetical protein